MKKIILAIAILFSSTLHADPFLDLIDQRTAAYRHSQETVMVIFKAEGDANSALTNIKTAMRTRDPIGIMNPFWIVNFLGEKVSMKTNCGVIIGQWYARGFPSREPWEKIMDHVIQKNAKSGVYLYTQDDEFRIDEKNRSQADAIKRDCLEGSRMAQTNINALSSQVAEHDPAIAAFERALILRGIQEFVGGGTDVSREEQEAQRRVERLIQRDREREMRY